MENVEISVEKKFFNRDFYIKTQFNLLIFKKMSKLVLTEDKIGYII